MNKSRFAPTPALTPIRIAATAVALLVGSGTAVAEEWTAVDIAFENFDDGLISGVVDSAYVVSEDGGPSELIVNYTITNQSDEPMDMVGIAVVVHSEASALSAGAEYTDFTKLEAGETRFVTRSFKEEQMGASVDPSITGAMRPTSGRRYNTGTQPCKPPIRSEAEFCEGWEMQCEMQCNNPLTYATGVSGQTCSCTEAYINGCWTYQCQATCVCQYHGIDLEQPDWSFNQFRELEPGMPWPENVLPADASAGYPLDLP